jgi:hypothetical protein
MSRIPAVPVERAGGLGRAVYRYLRRRFGRDGAVELTHAIALEDQRATFNHALGLVDQGFTSGEACRVPMPRADQAAAPRADQAGAGR